MHSIILINKINSNLINISMYIPNIILQEIIINPNMESFELNHLKNLLAKPPDSRSFNILKKIHSYLRFFAFYQDLSKDLSIDSLLDCCRKLNSQTFRADEFVVSLDEPLNKVYIVLSGKVIYKNEYNETIRKYGEGMFFGEEFLDIVPKHTYILSYSNNTILGYYSKEQYVQLLSKHREQQKIALVNFLQAQKQFTKWPKGSLIDLAFVLKRKVLEQGTKVYARHDLPKYVYIIFEGEAIIIAKGVSRLQTGDIIGLEEMKANKNYLSTCTVSRKSTILLLNRYDYLTSRHLWEMQDMHIEVMKKSLIWNNQQKILHANLNYVEGLLRDRSMLSGSLSKIILRESMPSAGSHNNILVQVRKNNSGTSFKWKRNINARNGRTQSISSFNLNQEKQALRNLGVSTSNSKLSFISSCK
jgi:hypothetical protein